MFTVLGGKKTLLQEMVERLATLLPPFSMALQIIKNLDEIYLESVSQKIFLENFP